MYIQPPLIREDFQPLPSGQGQYVVALQNKPGELDALTHATPEIWSQMTPLMHVLGPKRPGKVLSSDAVTNWIKKIRGAIGSHPCFLDTLRLRVEHPVASQGQTRTALSFIYDQARIAGIRFVPVFPIGGAETHRRLVHAASIQDCRGLAIRFNPLGSVPLPGTTQTEVLKELLVDFEAQPNDVDLLLDLGCLNPDEELEADDLRQLVNDLSDGIEWRNIILLGTSMPQALGSIREGQSGFLARHEWQLWSELKKKPPLRLPSFGDYAIQHPLPPQGTSGPGMRPNIRYTIDKATLVLRGVGPVTEDGKKKYRQLCLQLVSRKEFAGPSFSWGDEVIKDCADGVVEAGGQRMWRGAGTSHHLRFVVDQIRAA